MKPDAVVDGALARAVTVSRAAPWHDHAARLVPALTACVARLARAMPAWLDTACAIKGIDPQSAAAADELSGGPIAVARALQLARRAMAAVAAGELPRLPAAVRSDMRGRRSVAVSPALPFDRLLFAGHRCDVEVGPAPVQELPPRRDGIAVVLGAGNVTGIAPTDMLSKLVRDGLPTVVKLHPLFSPLRPLLDDVFAPLAPFGCRFVDGDGAVGAALAADARVTDVHLTGAVGTFRTLAAANAARVAPARLTAELGNVTPVVVLPGRWSAVELTAQVENVAAMLVNNGGFNCVAAKVLVTARGWEQRAEFVARLHARLAAIPSRTAWHPGAASRFERFAGFAPADPTRLPWTLVTDVRADAALPAFGDEAFGPLLWEVPLDAADLADFAARAAAFCNEQLAGDLAAMVLACRATRRQERAIVDGLLDALRYGVVALDVWAAFGFALMCVPWGAAPGNTVNAPGSGLGFVHDPWFLRDTRKTVIRGPVVPWPTPPWWPVHPAPVDVMRAILALTLRPSMRCLPQLAAAAWRGR